MDVITGPTTISPSPSPNCELSAESLYILHIADLHIGSNSGVNPGPNTQFLPNSGPSRIRPSRSYEYQQVFDKLFAIADAHPMRNRMMVLIAGDIFHHKVRYSGEDVEDFNYLIKGFGSMPIVIIPGNHDSNLNDKDRADLISPLVANSPGNVQYWKHSGWYKHGGVDFYHVSVFDKAVAGEIEQMVSADPKFKTSILLYHGMINGAIFGTFSVKNTRITEKVVAGVRLLLAGDIHQHQFIAPNAAYCGSLIQQNAGESCVKGAIIWDVAAGTGAFIPIANSSGFLRMDLRGKSPEHVDKILAQIDAPDNLLKVSVITDASDEAIEDQLRRVTDRFGIVNRVNRVYAHPPINPAEDITETLGEILLANGATDEQFEEIVTMHAGRITKYEYKKWHVTNLQWSNMFKYGPGNAIDFTKLTGGISGVVAANRAGKSSIIDVLVFGLFGEHLRADKKSMINTDARIAKIRVEFTVNGTQYYIERSDDRNHNASILLCVGSDYVANPTTGNGTGNGNGNGNGTGTGTGNGKTIVWTNITDISVDSTYRRVKQLIGTVDQFLSTGLYYEFRNDIIGMKRADRNKLLPELFGLVDNESILKDVKSKIKTIKDKIAVLVKPRTDTIDVLGGLTANAVIVHANRNQLAAKVTELDVAISHLTPPRDLVCSKVVIQNNQLVADRIDALIIQADAIHITDPVASADVISLTAKETLVGLQKAAAMATTISAAEYNTQMAILINAKPTTPPNIAELHKRSADYKATIIRYKGEVTNYQNQLAGYNQEINRLAGHLPAGHLPAGHLPPTQANIDNLTIALVAIKAQITTLVFIPIDSKYTASLQARYKRLRTETALQFSSDCMDCQHNKNYLCNDLLVVETELAAATMASNIATQANTVAKAQLTILNASKEYTGAMVVLFTKIISVGQSIKLATVTQERATGDLAAIVVSIALAENDLARLQQSQTEITRLKAARDQATAAEYATDKLARLYRYEQYQLGVLHCKLLAEIDVLGLKLQAGKKELLVVKTYESTAEQLTLLTSRRSTCGIALSVCDKSIGTLQAQIAVCEKELAIKAKYDEAYPLLAADHDKYKLYADAIGSTGLRIAVIRKNINRIISYANDILASITDFRMKCETSDNAIDLLMVENGHSFPISLGSGFQKFIMSIALRLALTSTLPSSPDFIIIDEGFGCMDPLNMIKIIDLFAGVASSNKFTFIISHIDEINNMIEYPLFIIPIVGAAPGLPSVGGAAPNTRSYINNCDIIANETAMEVVNTPGGPVDVMHLVNGELLCDCGFTTKTQKKLTMHRKTTKHANALAKLIAKKTTTVPT